MLWTVVIGTELFLLLNDITLFRAPKSELPGITGERIAELRDRVGGVRWQDPKDVVWNEARSGQPLYSGQSVMTVGESSARLVFDAKDGRSTEIEIGARTLLQLQAQKSGADRPLLLSLARGTFRATAGRALDLAAGEFSVRIDAGSRFEAENVDAAADGSGRRALRLTVREGAARVGNASAGRGQRIEIPLLTAEEKAHAPAAIPRILEAGEKADAAPAPSPAASRTEPESRALPPPTLRAPILRKRRPTPTPSAATSLFDLLFPNATADEPEEWEIELRWDAVSEARGYRIEIARTRDFGEKIAEKTTAEPRWTWPYRRGSENSKGRVYYRIATVNARGEVGAFSAPVPLAIPKDLRTPRAAAEAKPAPVARTERAEIPPAPAADSAAWSIRPAAELSSLMETSDSSQLRRVETGGPYFHETLAFARLSPESRAGGAIRANRFESKSGALPKTRRFGGFLAFERRTERFGGRLFLGAAAVLAERFEKADPRSLNLARGLSFGPSATFATPTASIVLRLPLTGLLGRGLLDGPFGPTARAERDWEIAALGAGNGRTPVFASLSLEGSYFFWDAPAGAKTTEWSIGIGPKVLLR